MAHDRQDLTWRTSFDNQIIPATYLNLWEKRILARYLAKSPVAMRGVEFLGFSLTKLPIVTDACVCWHLVEFQFLEKFYAIMLQKRVLWWNPSPSNPGRTIENPYPVLVVK